MSDSVSRETSPERVSRETLDRLTIFVDLLVGWSRTLNLVADPARIGVWRRHVEDSLRILNHLPEGTRSILDLGSGAGFPGLVVAVASGVPATLVEADHRKCAFLRAATRATAAPVTVICQRLESLAPRPVDVITARALAPLDQLLRFALPHVTTDTVCLFHKGPSFADELPAARARFRFRVTDTPGVEGTGAVILHVTDLARA